MPQMFDWILSFPTPALDRDCRFSVMYHARRKGSRIRFIGTA
jgi:hypothetical protein